MKNWSKNDLKSHLVIYESFFTKFLHFLENPIFAKKVHLHTKNYNYSFKIEYFKGQKGFLPAFMAPDSCPVKILDFK